MSVMVQAEHSQQADRRVRIPEEKRIKDPLPLAARFPPSS